MSNIPKSKRKPTQFQLFIDLSNIRHQLTEYICHDFSDDNIAYLRGTNNYNPQQWRYEHERMLLIDTIDRLQRYITESNSIYPITLKEYFERRRLATCAISTVEYLIQELQYISHDFSIRTDKYVGMIQTLISFEQKIKAWRGSVTRKQFHNYKAVKQLDNLFFQLFNLKYEDLKKWQKQQTKVIRMM